MHRLSHRWWGLSLGCLLILVGLVGTHPALAAGVVGNGTPGSCTETAFDNALNGGGNITFNCGANPKTISLSAYKNITINTTIDGGSKITLKAQTSRHFQVFAAVTLNLKNITLAKGTSNDGGSVQNFGTLKTNQVTFKLNTSSTDGGAITNYGTLVIKNSLFSANSADQDGGAIFNVSGTVNVKGSTFATNKAINNNYGGGAIHNSNGTVTIKGSNFTNNQAYNGGALFNSKTLSITGSKFTTNTATNGGGAIMILNGVLGMTTTTVSGNVADYGGGLVLYGTGNVVQRSTFSDNTSASDGGGIYNSSNAAFTNLTLSNNRVTGAVHGGGGLYQYNGTSTMTFATVANNTAAFGAGVYKEGSAGGSITLKNTVLSKNTGGNCGGLITSAGYNLSSDTNCGDFVQTGDRNKKNARLGALANNGGPTFTHLPLAGSPLISKGIAVVGITVDQRGVARPQGANVDIGAVEVP